jgi:hypothetical protein
MSSRKGFTRYWTPALKEAVGAVEAARLDADAALADEHRALFRRFGQRRSLWLSAVRCVAEFDCLQSLAAASATIPGLTRPKLVARGPATGGRPLLRLDGAFHLLAASHGSYGGSGGGGARGGGGSGFVPNCLALGGDADGGCGSGAGGGPEPVAALVTGPNMGGKSTLLRQTALLVLLAQLGCHVPAAKATLTPCDAIFTRVGAADRIMAGQSTFKVELEETSLILHNATADSLVILDELGARDARPRARSHPVQPSRPFSNGAQPTSPARASSPRASSRRRRSALAPPCAQAAARRPSTGWRLRTRSWRDSSTPSAAARSSPRTTTSSRRSTSPARRARASTAWPAASTSSRAT